jgi:hypothetical protein
MALMILTVLSLVLGGCGTGDSGQAAVDDYVKKECAILVDFKDRMGSLTRDFANNVHDQSALADTVEEMSKLYHELLAKSDELGEPPNGEGADGDDEVDRAARALADNLHAIAGDIRNAKSDAEVQSAVAHLNDEVLKSVRVAKDWKKQHPTPELDRAKKAIPGCADEPSGAAG